MRAVRSVFLLLAAAALCGCPVSVTGTVDGQAVPLSSGFFTQNSYGSTSYLSIMLYGIADACTTVSDARDYYATGPSTAEQVTWIEEHYPADYWAWGLTIYHSGSATEDMTGASLPGADGFSMSEGFATAVGYHYLKHPTEDMYTGAGVAEAYDDYVAVYSTKGGSLEISGHTPGESIQGSFSTSAQRYVDGFNGLFSGDAETVDAGDIALNFDVTRCTGAEYNAN